MEMNKIPVEAIPLHSRPLWCKIQRLLVAASRGSVPSHRACPPAAARPQGLVVRRRPLCNACANKLEAASHHSHLLHCGHQRTYQLEEGTTRAPHHLVRLDLPPRPGGIAPGGRQTCQTSRSAQQAGEVQEVALQTTGERTWAVDVGHKRLSALTTLPGPPVQGLAQWTRHIAPSLRTRLATLPR